MGVQSTCEVQLVLESFACSKGTIEEHNNVTISIGNVVKYSIHHMYSGLVGEQRRVGGISMCGAGL